MYLFRRTFQQREYWIAGCMMFLIPWNRFTARHTLPLSWKGNPILLMELGRIAHSHELIGHFDNVRVPTAVLPLVKVIV